MGNSPAWDSGCGWSGNRTASTLSSPLSSERERTLTPPGNKKEGWMLAASLRTVFTGPNPSASFARLVWRGLVLLLTLAAPAGAQTAAPEITSGATFSVKENATAVATLTATDTDAAQLRWSIPAGMAGGRTSGCAPPPSARAGDGGGGGAGRDDRGVYAGDALVERLLGEPRARVVPEWDWGDLRLGV